MEKGGTEIITAQAGRQQIGRKINDAQFPNIDRERNTVGASKGCVKINVKLA